MTLFYFMQYLTSHFHWLIFNLTNFSCKSCNSFNYLKFITKHKVLCSLSNYTQTIWPTQAMNASCQLLTALSSPCHLSSFTRLLTSILSTLLMNMPDMCAFEALIFKRILISKIAGAFVFLWQSMIGFWFIFWQSLHSLNIFTKFCGWFNYYRYFEGFLSLSICCRIFHSSFLPPAYKMFIKSVHRIALFGYFLNIITYWLMSSYSFFILRMGKTMFMNFIWNRVNVQ